MTRSSAKKPLPLVSIKAPKRDAARDNEAIETLVKDIFTNIRQRGDEAVRLYSERFDGVKLERFEVSEVEKKAADKTQNDKPAKINVTCTTVCEIYLQSSLQSTIKKKRENQKKKKITPGGGKAFTWPRG